MTLMFMGPQPPTAPHHPNSKESVENNRDNAIYDIIQRDNDQKEYEENLKWYEIEMKYYKEEQLESIGLIYEYRDKALAMNGVPMFTCTYLIKKILIKCFLFMKSR